MAPQTDACLKSQGGALAGSLGLPSGDHSVLTMYNSLYDLIIIYIIIFLQIVKASLLSGKPPVHLYTASTRAGTEGTW